MADEKQLREEIDALCADFEKEIKKGLQPNDYWMAKSAILAAKISALNDAISRRAERTTKSLLWLTAALAVLTFGLLVVAAAQIK
jgi:hypothetical protein